MTKFFELRRCPVRARVRLLLVFGGAHRGLGANADRLKPNPWHVIGRGDVTPTRRVEFRGIFAVHDTSTVTCSFKSLRLWGDNAVTAERTLITQLSFDETRRRGNK